MLDHPPIQGLISRIALAKDARREKWEVIEEFYDADVSGADPIETRPGFSALLDRIESNHQRRVTSTRLPVSCAIPIKSRFEAAQLTSLSEGLLSEGLNYCRNGPSRCGKLRCNFYPLVYYRILRGRQKREGPGGSGPCARGVHPPSGAATLGLTARRRSGPRGTGDYYLTTRKP
jgi:hypothetical protein